MMMRDYNLWFDDRLDLQEIFDVISSNFSTHYNLLNDVSFLGDRGFSIMASTCSFLIGDPFTFQQIISPIWMWSCSWLNLWLFDPISILCLIILSFVSGGICQESRQVMLLARQVKGRLMMLPDGFLGQRTQVYTLQPCGPLLVVYEITGSVEATNVFSHQPCFSITILGD
jgi:hypothetical protein